MNQLNLPDDLYPYQKDDLDQLLNTDENFLDLSEMGTGKTPVALGLSQLGNFQKTLIVCPNTLKLEWARQIRDWMGINPTMAHKSCYRRLDPLFHEMLGTIESTPFFIINYETFRTKRHREILNEYPFDLVILDEAHKLRNLKTRMTKGMFEFYSFHPSTRLLALTGSPIVNNPADLFSLLCLLKPEQYKPRERMSFIRKYCYYYPTRYGIKIYGTHNLSELREETKPFTIRHTKKEVLPYLPEKYQRRVTLEMSPKQRDVYKKMEGELYVMLDTGEPLWAPSVMAQIMRLRQINTDPAILGVDAPSIKTDFILQTLESSDSKVVIFSCFEKYIRRLDSLISTPHIVISGRIPVEERLKAVDRFQSDDSVRYALGTIQCMGEGITLTSASDCILADRWWNPSVNTQAEDRLHRIGQKSAVQVINPIVENSIDATLDQILDSKKTMATEYLGLDVTKEVIEERGLAR